MELPIFVDHSAWKVVSSSSDSQGEEAQNAIDGDPSTHWHTRWHEPIPEFPHSIVVDMASLLVVDKFIYTARHSNDNGHVKDYELSFSKDGKNWGQPITSGTFHIGTATQTIEFTPCRARYVKLLGLSAHDKGKKAAIAELEIISEE